MSQLQATSHVQSVPPTSRLGGVVMREAVMFGVIGVVNTLNDFVVYYTLTRSLSFFEDRILLAKALAFIVASVFSFIMNRRLTFRVSGPVTVSQLVRFYSTSGVAIVINVGSMYVLTHVFAVYDLFALVLTTGLTFVWSFIFSKFWVFNRS